MDSLTIKYCQFVKDTCMIHWRNGMEQDISIFSISHNTQELKNHMRQHCEIQFDFKGFFGKYREVYS